MLGESLSSQGVEVQQPNRTAQYVALVNDILAYSVNPLPPLQFIPEHRVDDIRALVDGTISSYTIPSTDIERNIGIVRMKYGLDTGERATNKAIATALNISSTTVKHIINKSLNRYRTKEKGLTGLVVVPELSFAHEIYGADFQGDMPGYAQFFQRISIGAESNPFELPRLALEPKTGVSVRAENADEVLLYRATNKQLKEYTTAYNAHEYKYKGLSFQADLGVSLEIDNLLARTGISVNNAEELLYLDLTKLQGISRIQFEALRRMIIDADDIAQILSDEHDERERVKADIKVGKEAQKRMRFPINNHLFPEAEVPQDVLESFRDERLGMGMVVGTAMKFLKDNNITTFRAMLALSRPQLEQIFKGNGKHMYEVGLELQRRLGRKMGLDKEDTTIVSLFTNDEGKKRVEQIESRRRELIDVQTEKVRDEHTQEVQALIKYAQQAGCATSEEMAEYLYTQNIDVLGQNPRRLISIAVLDYVLRNSPQEQK